jgi:hypothetical protein
MAIMFPKRQSPRLAKVPGAYPKKGLEVKTFSASIVVLAGAVLLTGGSFIQHGDTKLFLQALGCLVGIMGLAGWFLAFKHSSEK